MPFFSKIKKQFVHIITLCESSETDEPEISFPTQVCGDYIIEGLTEEQQAWIHHKACSDASFPSTPGHRLTRSSFSVMSSLPGPLPEPFCERPRQVPPFPVRRCVSNPFPNAFLRQSLPITRSQSAGNKLNQPLPDEGGPKSRYAPRYRPVKIDSAWKSRPVPEETQISWAPEDRASRPNSFYSISRPSSDVLPCPTLANRLRPSSRYRPTSLGLVNSLSKPRPTSIPHSLRFSCSAIYDHVVESNSSIVEPLSFYRAQLDTLAESFLKEALASDARSVWSSCSSVYVSSHCGEEEESDGSDNEDGNSDICSIASATKEAVIGSLRAQEVYV